MENMIHQAKVISSSDMLFHKSDYTIFFLVVKVFWLVGRIMVLWTDDSEYMYMFKDGEILVTLLLVFVSHQHSDWLVKN